MIRAGVVAKGLARAGLEAVVRELAPEVELVDPSEADVLVVIGEIAANEQRPPVILLADQARRDWLSLEPGGVAAILPQNVQPAELLAAMQAVLAGLLVLHPMSLRETAPIEAPILTPRELEVLRRLSEGLPNKLIAHELGISEHTVKFHVAQILSKLQAGSRTEAVTAGLRLGIVQL